jgi:hypothetical protein
MYYCIDEAEWEGTWGRWGTHRRQAACIPLFARGAYLRRILLDRPSLAIECLRLHVPLRCSYASVEHCQALPHLPMRDNISPRFVGFRKLGGLGGRKLLAGLRLGGRLLDAACVAALGEISASVFVLIPLRRSTGHVNDAVEYELGLRAYARGGREARGGRQ